MRFRTCFILFVLFFAFSSGASANMKVTFFPSGAEVSEQRTLELHNDSGDQYVEFELPGHADPETLTVSGSGEVVITDISWFRNNLIESSAVSAIRLQLEKAITSRDEVSARLKAAEGGIEYWKSGNKDDVSKTALKEKVADIVVANLSEAYLNLYKLQIQLDKKQAKVDSLNNKLSEASGRVRNVWSVRASISKASSGSTPLKLRYMVNNCGWTPIYRLDAYPDQNIVKFSFEAKIHQASGFDLNNTEIELATIRPLSQISPPVIPEWNIRPEVKRRIMPLNMVRTESSKTVASDSISSVNVEQKATYSLWKLGRRNIPAGKERKYNLSNEEWKADFSYLARPSLSDSIYVSARVKHAEAVDFPLGKVFIFMEGTMLGSKHIDLSGKDTEMYFGSDPMLKAEFKTIEKASGENGIFSSDQTYDWRYLVNIINNRTKDCAIRIEEPMPVSGDKRIKLEFETSPEAELKDHNFIWKVSVPASSKISVKYSIKMKAPDDMKLDLGIRG